jgi:hypothetical protein
METVYITLGFFKERKRKERGEGRGERGEGREDREGRGETGERTILR